MSVLRRKLIRDIGRRRSQFVAIVVTVLLGVMLFGASYDAYQNLLASYHELFRQTHFAALTIEGGDRRQVAAAVEKVPGVDGVATRATAELPLRVKGTTLLARLVGRPAGAPPAVNDVLILAGTDLPAGSETSVLAERHLADHFGLSPGDTVEILGPAGSRQLTVAGIAASAEYIWPARSRQEVLTLPDEFGVLFVPMSLVDGLPAALTTQQTMVTYRGAADDPALTDQVTSAALAAGATDAFTQAEQPSNAALQEDINGFGEMAVAFPAMFLTAAALAAFVLLGRMVSIQQTQIGLMMAEGFGRRRIFRHYLGFGLVVGLPGALIGALLGLVLGGVISRIYTDVIAIPITVIEVRPVTLAIGVVVGVAAGLLAALAPAARASRLSPAMAMSGHAGPGHGGESRLERLLPPLRRLPARWKMVVRGIGRSPIRSLTTVAGVMIAVTLVLVSWGMIDTVQVLLDRQFNQAEQADAVVYVPAGVSAETITRLDAVDGVAAAEPLAQLPVTVEHEGQRYTTTMAGLPADTTMHRFLTDGGTVPLPGDGILVGQALRSTLSLRVGDTVRLTFGSLGREATTTVAGFVNEPLGTYAYASLDQLGRLLDPAAVTGATTAANLRLDPGADRPAVIDRLKALAGVGAVVDPKALQRAADGLMGLFYVFVGAMLVLGAVMAFALLYNLMSANISERITELASLRASGLSGRELGRIITAENVLLTLVGIGPGLLVGYLGAAQFMASFSSDLFSFDLQVRPTTFLFTALGILAAALVSQLPILRAVGRIDIARVVRERAL